MGSLAIELEELVYRDKAPLGEAIATLRSRHGARHSREELEKIYEELPRRSPPRVHSPEPLASLAGPSRADEGIENRRCVEISTRVAKVVNSTIEAMTAEDRQILRMRFVDGRTTASIARALRTDQRRLYRRFARCLRALRSVFEGTGIADDDVRMLIGWPSSELTFPALAGERAFKSRRRVDAAATGTDGQISGGSKNQLRAL